MLAGHSFIAYLPIGLGVLLLFCGVWYVQSDVSHYQCYAVAFWQGSSGLTQVPSNLCTFFSHFGIDQKSITPFHLLPLEYPPLTLSLFSAAYLAPPQAYQLIFGLMMAGMALLIYWLLLRYGPRGAGLAYVFFLVIGAWATALGRFDMVPAALTLLCLIATERKHWTLAYVALAFGVLFKIYPLLFLPVLFLAEQRAHELYAQPSASLKLLPLPDTLWRAARELRQWRWKNLLLFWALIAVITGFFTLLNFQGALLSQLSYFANRPIQLEATGSTALWLTSRIGHPVWLVQSFGSFNLVSDLGHRVALISEVCFALGYLLVLLGQWRGQLDLVQSCITLLLIFIVTSKVFSPQYLMWLLPLLAYNGSFQVRWFVVLWGSISLLTTAIYPYMYMYVKTMSPRMHLTDALVTFIVLVTLRNILMALATLAFLFNWWKAKRRQRGFPIS